MRYVIIIICIVLVVFGLSFLIPNPEEKSTSMQNSDTNKEEATLFTLTSDAFADGASIPTEYTCEGKNTSPALSWSGAPEGTASFVLTMYDPDVPTAVRPEGFFDHFVLFNIPADTTRIEANSIAGTPGGNSRGTTEYRGPCPPADYEPSEHRYIFTLYSLDTTLELKEGASRADVETAVLGHVLGKAVLTGKYKKIKPETP